MKISCLNLFLLLTAVWTILPGVTPAAADDHHDSVPLVIDTDLGIDDAVALALALQHPQADVLSIVATPGVSSGEKAVPNLERLLTRLNRRDVKLYAPAQTLTHLPAPPFRVSAESAVSKPLADGAWHGMKEVKPFHLPFASFAYAPHGRQATVLVLGPLSNLAAAIQANPTLADGITRVVIAGPPDPKDNWNLRYDKAAFKIVEASGMRIEFVDPAGGPAKPRSWRDSTATLGTRTSVGEEFILHMLDDLRVRAHYVEVLGGFYDELALLYCLDDHPFTRDLLGGLPKRYHVKVEEKWALLDDLLSVLNHGRQLRPHVVLSDKGWPEENLRPDLRSRFRNMIAANGEVEFFQQVVASEMHEHLGVYSVIGVKMGLRAAELLNAPPHAMTVVSHCAARPPVSCLNDGLIVATGSTPGRGLFSHAPGKPGMATERATRINASPLDMLPATQVTFSYNGKSITLRIKDPYLQQIKERIGALLKRHGLEDPAYWAGVRSFGLEVWQEWHRKDIFTVREVTAAAQ